MSLWWNETETLRGHGLCSRLQSRHPGWAHSWCWPIRTARNLGLASLLQNRYCMCDCLNIAPFQSKIFESQTAYTVIIKIFVNWTSVFVCFRPHCASLHASHGRGRHLGRQNRHYLTGEASVLWFFFVPQGTLWQRVLHDTHEEGSRGEAWYGKDLKGRDVNGVGPFNRELSRWRSN